LESEIAGNLEWRSTPLSERNTERSQNYGKSDGDIHQLSGAFSTDRFMKSPRFDIFRFSQRGDGELISNELN
jgi:hypothetical protein